MLNTTRYQDNFGSGYSAYGVCCQFCWVFFLFEEVPHGSHSSIEHGLSFCYAAFQNNEALQATILKIINSLNCAFIILDPNCHSQDTSVHSAEM